MLFHGLTRADGVLCAGGTRTKQSLLAGGCPERIIFDSLDCGISDDILDRNRLRQSGINLKFVHFGRLVFHKGTALIIESLAKTKLPICLDIIGRGPELDRCKQLAEDLGAHNRVRFLDWFPSHNDLLNSFGQYRGALLPSLEDANGIVVQEFMALGMPTICLNWGGPQLLIQDQVSGFLIEPRSRDHVVLQMAELLDKLASDDLLAEMISVAARQRAEEWRWSRLAGSWVRMYQAVHNPLFQ